MLPREGCPALDDQVDHRVGQAAIASGIVFVVMVFLYYVVGALEFHRQGRSDRRRGGLSRQVVDRAQAELQKTGATWIATTDYRTYAMLRWYLQRPRAGDPDQRARPVSSAFAIPA